MNELTLFLGIDYSGAQTPTSRLKNLQVYAAQPGGVPQKRFSPARSNNGQPFNWTRAEIAQFLLEQARQGVRFIAGIDHGVPLAYFRRYGLASWPEFLADFAPHWPTDGNHVYVDFNSGILTLIFDKSQNKLQHAGALRHTSAGVCS